MLRSLVLFRLLLGAVAMHSAMVEVTATAVNPEKGAVCLPCPQETNINPPLDARDCSDYYNFGRRESGVYVIRPNGVKDCFLVYCEMEKDGGAWTVIQRRGNYGRPADYFYKTWAEYKQGFGDLDLEFWLGNDKISAITKQGKYQLKVDVIDLDWKYYNYTYGVFKVEGELELYKLSIGEPSTEAAEYIFQNFNGMRFSTPDRDNDAWLANTCTGSTYGAWWYKDCGYSNLNSKRTTDKSSNFFYMYTPERVDLRYSQLMIRK